MSEFRRKLMMAYAANLGRDNITYPGLIAAWSAKGKTNDDEDRAILKDLTGNGHDITLNGFAFSEMSGYGGYNVGESNGWGAYVNWQNKYDLYEFSHNKIHIKGCKSSWEISKLIQASNCIWESFKIKLTRNKPSIKIQYRYIDETGTVRENNYLKDGINIIPKSYNLKEGSNNPRLGIFGFTTFYTDPDFECTIELIPEYPDALVFDGVDDYGINEDMPILTDYTLIAKREIFEKKINSCFSGYKSDAYNNPFFLLENYAADGKFYANNKGLMNNLNDDDAGNYTISYQNSNVYNGVQIKSGSALVSLQEFAIGNGTNLANKRYWQGAFYSAYLFDRSLDEQEIKAFIRKYIDPEYLLPSEIPTPDCYYDFSQGSNDDKTRDTIKDYSGNGNDAVAHNFAWNEEGSGYKDGALVFDGIDDYVSLDAFDSGFKTVFMICKPFKTSTVLYDQRIPGIQNQFAFFNHPNLIAYSERKSVINYINGKINTELKCGELINKKHLIVGGATELNNFIPKIGCTTAADAYHANIALYKFLGFKEALTEEQIQAIIKKYNLLDGVDEIEVS